MIRPEPKYLMMIEPTTAKEPAVEDELTNIAEKVLALTKKGTTYRGWHQCRCGANSGNADLITTDGKITNSLLVHYVKEHRNAVPVAEIEKLRESFATIKK